MKTLFRRKDDRSVIRVNAVIFLVQLIVTIPGLLIFHRSEEITAVWPAAGAALYFLLRFGKVALPGIFLGTLFGTYIPAIYIFPDVSPVLLLFSGTIFGAGTITQALTGNFLIKRFIKTETLFLYIHTVNYYILFILFAGIPGAVFGILALTTTGINADSRLLISLVDWWLANSVGMLLITSLFLGFKGKLILRLNINEYLELLILVLLLLLTEYLLINGRLSHVIIEASPYFFIPFLLWIAFRFDFTVLFTFILMISVGIILNNIMHIGPFTGENLHESVIMAQLSVGITTAMLLLMSAAIFRLRKVSSEIRMNNERLEKEVEHQTRQLALELEKRKYTEIALRESEDRYHKLSDMTFEGIVLHKQGKVIDVNEAFVRMTGYSKEEILGKDIFETIAFPEYIPLIRQKIQSDDNEPYEIKLKRKNGKVLFAEVEAKTVSYKRETIRVKALRDITQKIEEKHELKKLHTAIEQSGSSIVITDTSGKIEYVNPAFLEITGYSSDEVIGKNPRVLKTDYHDSSYYKALWETISKGQTWRGEFLNRKKNGKLYWENATITPVVNEKQEITNYISIKEDITLRKEDEELLKERMNFIELINEISSSFISANAENIDHEINKALHLIAEFTGVDRGYVIQQQKGERQILISHSYCRDGLVLPVPEILDTLQNPSLYNQLFKNTNYTLRCRESLGDEPADRLTDEFMSKASFNSVITVPMKIAGNLSGYMMFDSMDKGVERFQKFLGAFLLTGQIIGNVLKRKETETALKESEEMFRAFFENNSAVILLINPDNGKLEDANRAASLYYGFSKDQLKNMTFFDLDAIRNLEAAEVLNRLKDAAPNYYSFRHKLSNGRIKDVELYPTLIQIGSQSFLFSIVQDVTRRKKAIKALQESESKKLALLKIIPDLIYVISRKGEFLDIYTDDPNNLEYPPEKILGSKYYELFPKKLTSLFRKYINMAFATREIQQFEYITEDENDRNVRYEEVRFIVSGEDELIAISRDITSQKQAETDLKMAKEAAEQANQAKSIFLANISHEIRTPINAVVGFTDLLDHQLQEPVYKNYLQSIKTSSKTLLDLINDLLDLSKIEAGKMNIQYSSVDIIAVFEEIRQLFSLRVNQSQLDFFIDIDTDFPRYVVFDELKLRQILINLVGNSVKFTEKGYIRLKAGTTGTHSSRGKNKVDIRISVEDTGIGISKEDQDKIFEAFRQQDELDTRKYGGTGLGLTITKRLVEMLNGEIGLESKPGKGSLFNIIFHGVETETEAESGKAEMKIKISDIVFEQATIMVIDSIETSKKLVRDILQNTNSRIIEAENWEQGIKQVEKYHPDLILVDTGNSTDKNMPSSGILKKIAALDTPVIALVTRPYDKKVFTKTGFSGIVGKPLQVTELYSELLKYIPYHYSREVLEYKDEYTNFSDMPESVLDQLPKIVKTLEGKLNKSWKNATDTSAFVDIGEFAVSVKETGRQYNIGALIKLGDNLAEAVDRFDIDTINRILGIYPEIINTLKKMMN